MSEPTVVHSTFVLERSFPQAPERVFTALSDPAKKRRWFAEGEHQNKVEEFSMEFRAGGSERLRVRMGDDTPFPGVELVNQGHFQDIVANRRIVTAATMMLGGRCISASLVTMELLPASTGTDLILTHQGAYFEGSGGPQLREEGWRTLLDSLGRDLAQASGHGQGGNGY